MNTPVLLEITGGIARVTLNQPERRNALDFDLARALNVVLAKVADDPGVKVALLAANGPAFCAGMDLKAIALDDPVQAREFSLLLAESYRRLMTLPMPLLAAVDGPAMGGAVGLALAADFVWIGPAGRFAFPETKVGVVPALVSVVARRRMAPGRLMGWSITGAEMPPDQALALGLADFAASSTAVEEAGAFALRLVSQNSGEAMRRTKRFLQAELFSRLEPELDSALQEFKLAVATDACRTGLAAFRSKQPPKWD